MIEASLTSSCGVRKIASATAIEIVSARVVSIVCAHVYVCARMCVSAHTRAHDLPVSSTARMQASAFVRIQLCVRACVCIGCDVCICDLKHSGARTNSSAAAIASISLGCLGVHSHSSVAVSCMCAHVS